MRVCLKRWFAGYSGETYGEFYLVVPYEVLSVDFTFSAHSCIFWGGSNGLPPQYLVDVFLCKANSQGLLMGVGRMVWQFSLKKISCVCRLVGAT